MKKQSIKNVLSCILNQSHLKMKVTMLFLFLSLFQLNAFNGYGQNQKVTLNVEKVPLTQIFQQIESQTNLNFFYNSSELDVREKVSIDVKNSQILDFLEQLFHNKGISYQILGNQIVLKRVIVKKNLDNTLLTVQKREVNGIIKDKTGMPLVGVTVVIEGTQSGSVSNFNGEYKIALKENETVLVFSSLGYKTQRIEVGSRIAIDIIMEEDFSQLDEVVLIGYGEQTRDELTGAVSSVSAENIVQAATGTIGFDRSLGGLVKGLQVSQSSGRPGAPMQLNIRGITSPLSGFGRLNQPLYVIDGIPFNTDALQGTNPLLTINPNDIEHFDVLRDAAATSIYGSRGANGVIIVETKKGKRNQTPTVNVSLTTTLAQPINTIDVLNASQYRSFYDTLISNTVAAMNAGQIDPFFAFDLQSIGKVDLDFNTFQVSYDGLNDAYFGDADTDWNKEVFRSLAVTKQANVSLNGGSEKTNYALSLAFIDQEGLTVKDGLKQYTLGMALGTDLTSKIKIGGNANLSHVEANSGEDDILGFLTVNSSIAKARPDLSVYNANGELLGQSDFANGFETFEPNPLMRLENKTNNKNYNFIGNAYLEIEPIQNLKLKADVNTAVFYADNSSFIPKITQTDFVFFPNESYLSETSSLVSNVTSNLTAYYNMKFENHRLGFLIGAAWDRTNFENKSHFYTGFPDDEVLINGSSAASVAGYTSNRVESGLNSFFSRFTYGYKNLYNATLNFRTDVSSKFGPDNQRAYFPSLSTSWNIANESFMLNNQTFNILKLRASAGRVGSTNVSDFAYLQFFQKASNDLYNGNSAVIPNNNFPNTNIGWEETEEINLGLDFELFNSRLRGGIDVYTRKTTGALASTPLPLELGPSTFFSNFVDISNKGVELSLGGDIVKAINFTWSSNINWSLNRNKLDKLNGANINQFQLDNFIEGEPVGTIKGYRVVKIFQDQAEVDALNAASSTGLYDLASTSVGDFMYEDISGDGKISTDDRTIIGGIEPDYFGGISNTFIYKNFTLTALMQYSVGAERTWSNIPFGTYNLLGENKYSEYALNTWTPQDTKARYARALYFDPSASNRSSDRYLYDTSYLRLKSLQLSYNFDSDFMNKLGVNNARLVLTGTNLLTFTNWPGMDPETFSERGGITDRVDNKDPYPLSKSVSLGIQVQF